MLKKTDIVAAVQQALNESQGVRTYNISIQPIVNRVLQLLEMKADNKQVLLD